MFCMNCGTQLADDAKFCISCGTPAGQTIAPSNPSIASQGSRTPNAAANEAAISSSPFAQVDSSRIIPFEMFTLKPIPAGVPTNQLDDVSTSSGKRSEMYIPCSMPVEQAYNNACHILVSNDFSPKAYKGEMIWKKGLGLMSKMQYVKVVPMEGHLYVQGWMAMAGLGDVAFIEQPLGGFSGAIFNSPAKNILMTIEASC